MTEILKEQIKVVATARQRTLAFKNQRDALLEEWNKTHQVLFDALTQSSADVAIEEAKLRELTLLAYAETGNRAPVPGVSVKIFQMLDYDPKEALKWAISHRLALKLDVPAFEKIAKVEDIPFVIITTEPRAQIATNLDSNA